MRLSYISRFVVAAVLVAFALPMAAQFTDRAAYEELGGQKEFTRRRAELGKQCKTGQVLLFARRAEPEASHYREDNDFYYYTGVADPGSAVLIDCATGNAMLMEPEQSKREIQYMGSNVLSLPEAEQDKLGFSSVMSITALDRMLSGMFGSKETDLWLRLGFADAADGARGETGQAYVDIYQNPYGATLPLDREIIKKIRERYPLARLHDITPAIAERQDQRRRTASSDGESEAGNVRVRGGVGGALLVSQGWRAGRGLYGDRGLGREWERLALFVQSKEDGAERSRGVRLRGRSKSVDDGHYADVQHEREVYS